MSEISNFGHWKLIWNDAWYLVLCQTWRVFVIHVAIIRLLSV
jgi:hypothetical protein